MDRLKGLGWVHEKGEGIYKAVAKQYADFTEKGMTVAATAPIHKEKNQVSKAIREELKERGHLAKKEATFTSLRPKNWTEADRKDLTNYEVGQVIKFEQNSKGVVEKKVAKKPELTEGNKKNVHQNGQTCFVKSGKHEVVSVTGEKVIIQDLKTKKQAVLPTGQAKNYSVYEREGIAIAQGEQIRISANSRKDKVHNGQILKVKAIHKNEIECGNGV